MPVPPKVTVAVRPGGTEMGEAISASPATRVSRLVDTSAAERVVCKAHLGAHARQRLLFAAPILPQQHEA